MGQEASPKLFFEVLLLGNWNNDMKTFTRITGGQNLWD